MNAGRALHLQTGHVLVAIACGRAQVMLGGEHDQIIPYCDGDRAYVVRYDEDSPEAVRMSDGQPLGRINLRNWEPVTHCDPCKAEHGEHELKRCGTCGLACCNECFPNHTVCGRPRLNRSGWPPTLVHKMPKSKRSQR